MATKKDFTQVAHAVVMQATGTALVKTETLKQVAGRKGGKKGGASRAIILTPEQRSEIARVAAQARWKKA